MTMGFMDPYREQRQEVSCGTEDPRPRGGGAPLALAHAPPKKTNPQQQAKRRGEALSRRLGRKLVLNEFEQLLAANVLNPQLIDVSLDDVGGLENAKAEIRTKVLRPLTEPGLYCTTLWRPVKGVLLFGPPGTGKTMLAKAVAREGGAFFLNVTASAVMSKWLGDANRLIRAVFTLAAKLEPCIVFVDEVESLLTKRGGATEHEATLQAKTEFMQLWDGVEGVGRGFGGAPPPRIVVMGATNRPWMVDEAVLRRFALQYEIGPPGPKERASILQRYLRRHDAEMAALAGAGYLPEGARGVEPALLRPFGAAPALPLRGGGAGGGGASEGIEAIVALTEGYSGSDLMELCAQAAQDVLAERWGSEEEEAQQRQRQRQQRQAAAAEGDDDAAAPPDPAAAALARMRPVRLADLKRALARVRPSTQLADEYASRTAGGFGGRAGAVQDDILGGGLGGGAGAREEALGALLAAAAAAAAGASRVGGGQGGPSLASEARAADIEQQLQALLARLLQQQQQQGGGGGGNGNGNGNGGR
jgi:SpoVK/Ycf46/Vps4 family AAA+-type ATPase